jgi:ring-1,2-phenylacetyl-CoA epoxidase subunit PaaE
VLLLTLVRVVTGIRPAHVAGPTGGPQAPALTFHQLRVAEVRRETPDAVSVRFEVPPDIVPVFRFRPGQHVVLRARMDDGAIVSRPYSICSAVTDGELRIAVRHLPGGRMSTWVNTVLRPGDVVDVAPPAGTFATGLDEGASRRVLGVAAGSGITPVISILGSILATEPASRCTLLYGNRTAASTLFAARLTELQGRYPGRLQVVHIRSREGATPPGLSGRLDLGVLHHLAECGELAGMDEAYVCGPGPMTTVVRDCLIDDLHLPRQRVHTELFVRGPVTSDDGEGTVRVRHGGVEQAVHVAAGESVLDAGLRAGLDLPYSCRAGVCGLCRATVVSGSATEVVSTCQIGSRARIRVDFDAVAVRRPAART